MAGIYTLVRTYGFANLAFDILLQMLLYCDKNFPKKISVEASYIVLVALNNGSRPNSPY